MMDDPNGGGDYLYGKMMPFFWQLLKRKLPTKSTLQRRGINMEITSAIYNLDEEDIDHLFASCPKVQRVGADFAMGEFRTGVPSDLDSISGGFEGILKNKKYPNFGNFHISSMEANWRSL
ncbi:hypothetical protein VNO77_33682 [Canavalia gladiata]|uniref:Reverse transcriptase zinc-binding domain-containing protein n=1 Tax=Canavalia gladiata TaxID=3824 RepID=A0AAN9KDT3_CANGL